MIFFQNFQRKRKANNKHLFLSCLCDSNKHYIAVHIRKFFRIRIVGRPRRGQDALYGRI